MSSARTWHAGGGRRRPHAPCGGRARRPGQAPAWPGCGKQPHLPLAARSGRALAAEQPHLPRQGVCHYPQAVVTRARATEGPLLQGLAQACCCARHVTGATQRAWRARPATAMLQGIVTSLLPPGRRPPARLSTAKAPWRGSAELSGLSAPHCGRCSAVSPAAHTVGPCVVSGYPSTTRWSNAACPRHAPGSSLIHRSVSHMCR